MGGERITVAVAGQVMIDELVTAVEPQWSEAIGRHFESPQAVA